MVCQGQGRRSLHERRCCEPNQIKVANARQPQGIYQKSNRKKSDRSIPRLKVRACRANKSRPARAACWGVQEDTNQLQQNWRSNKPRAFRGNPEEMAGFGRALCRGHSKECEWPHRLPSESGGERPREWIRPGWQDRVASGPRQRGLWLYLRGTLQE